MGGGLRLGPAVSREQARPRMPGAHGPDRAGRVYADPALFS